MDHGRIIYYNGAYWHVHRTLITRMRWIHRSQGTASRGACAWRP
jgi:hypothetical protein